MGSTSSFDEAYRARQFRRRAEVLLRRPPLNGALGGVREAVIELQVEAASELDEVDAQLRHALATRRALVERLRACSRALVGTGRIDDPATGRSRQYLRARGAPIRDPQPDASGRPVLRGEALRVELVDLLHAIGSPVAVHELTRLLVLAGHRVDGRPSQTISNALAVAIDRGTVRRVRRGCYEAVPKVEPSA